MLRKMVKGGFERRIDGNNEQILHFVIQVKMFYTSAKLKTSSNMSKDNNKAILVIKEYQHRQKTVPYMCSIFTLHYIKFSLFLRPHFY